MIVPMQYVCAGTSTTNLLKHMKVKHPAEAELCLEASKHSGIYKARRGKNGTGESLPGPSGVHDIKSAINSEADQSARLQAGDRPTVQLRRGIVLHCALDLRPWCGKLEPGLQVLMKSMGTLASLAAVKLSIREFNQTLQEECEAVTMNIRSRLKWQQQFIPFGQCVSLQIHSWTRPSSAYVYATMTASCVTTEWNWQRLGMSVRIFHTDRYTLRDVESWILGVTAEYFGKGVLPSQVFLCCTTNSGKHLKEAVSNLGISHLPCTLGLIREAVSAGLASAHNRSIAMFVQRLIEVTDMLMESSTPGNAHEVLGTAVMDAAADPCDMGAVLELMRRVLLLRTDPSMACMLEEGEWLRVRDAVGVLEACAEVDSGIRDGEPPPLLGSVAIIEELQEYLSEDLVYVPDLDRDTEADRIEASVGELDSAVQQMRSIITWRVQQVNFSRPSTSPAMIACLLDPRTKADSALPALGSEESWTELGAIYDRARYSLSIAAGSSYPEAGPGEGPGFEPEQHFQDLLGRQTLMPTRNRTPGEQFGRFVPPPAGGPRAEIDSYRRIPSLPLDGIQTLSWWRSRAWKEEGSAPALLPLIAAQQLSIDPSTCKATQLFSKVGHLLPGLELKEPIRNIQRFLFLKLNQQFVKLPSLAQNISSRPYPDTASS